MLTGKRAFDGAEVTDVLAAVIKDTLPIDALPPETPSAIRRLLRRCLQKDRNERLDSMAAVRLEIADALTPASSAGDAPGAISAATSPAAARPARFDIWKPIAALALVAAALAWWAAVAWRSPSSATDGRIIRFNAAAPGILNGVSITPSGDTLSSTQIASTFAYWPRRQGARFRAPKARAT